MLQFAKRFISINASHPLLSRSHLHCSSWRLGTLFSTVIYLSIPHNTVLRDSPLTCSTDYAMTHSYLYSFFLQIPPSLSNRYRMGKKYWFPTTSEKHSTKRIELKLRRVRMLPQKCLNYHVLSIDNRF